MNVSMNINRMIYQRIHNIQAYSPLIWIRSLIVVGVVLSCIALAIVDTQSGLIFLVVIEFGILALLLFYNYPPLGIAVLILASLLIPFELGTGTQTNINVTILLLPPLIGLWLLRYVLTPEKTQAVFSRSILAGIVFIIIGSIAFLHGFLLKYHGTNASIPAQISQLAVFILSIGAFLLGVFQIKSLSWLKRITWLFLSIGGINIIAHLVPVFGHIVFPLYAAGSTGSIFWVWLVAISFSQALYNTELRKGWRVTLAILCISTLYVSLTEGLSWASGWLPSLIAVLVVILTGSPKVGLFTTLVGLPIIVLQFRSIQGIILINEAYSMITRQAAWVSVMQLVQQSPILGLGPANYYWYTASQPIMGWYVYFSSHNNYVDIIAQTGLLGFASFIWFIGEIARSGLRLRTKAPKGFARAYVYGALGGLVGTLVAGLLGDWFLPFVYNIGLAGMRSSILTWLFLGGMVAIAHFSRVHDEEVETVKVYL